MSEADTARMSWAARVTWFLGICTSVIAIAGGLGFKFGQDKQAERLNLYINNVVGSLAPEQRQSAQPVLTHQSVI